jgi:kumamolisin
MTDRKVFHDSIVPIPVDSGPAPRGLLVQAATPDDHQEQMSLHFSLSLPEATQAELEAKVAAGETVDPATLNGHYAAKQADSDNLVAWLKKNGYKIEHVTRDNASIYASAPVKKIEKSLDVRMVRVNKDGFSYIASQNAPSLPLTVGAPVQAGHRRSATVPARPEALPHPPAPPRQPPGAGGERQRPTPRAGHRQLAAVSAERDAQGLQL